MKARTLRSHQGLRLPRFKGRPEIIMPQTFAIILFLKFFKNLAIIPQPFATILTLFSTGEVKI